MFRLYACHASVDISNAVAESGAGALAGVRYRRDLYVGGPSAVYRTLAVFNDDRSAQALFDDLEQSLTSCGVVPLTNGGGGSLDVKPLPQQGGDDSVAADFEPGAGYAQTVYRVFRVGNAVLVSVSIGDHRTPETSKLGLATILSAMKRFSS